MRATVASRLQGECQEWHTDQTAAKTGQAEREKCEEKTDKDCVDIHAEELNQNSAFWVESRFRKLLTAAYFDFLVFAFTRM